MTRLGARPVRAPPPSITCGRGASRPGSPASAAPTSASPTGSPTSPPPAARRPPASRAPAAPSRRVVIGAAQGELLVVQGAGGSVTSLPAAHPPCSSTSPPGRARAAAMRHVSGRPTASTTASAPRPPGSSARSRAAPAASRGAGWVRSAPKRWARSRRSGCGSASSTRHPRRARSPARSCPCTPPPRTSTVSPAPAARRSAAWTAHARGSVAAASSGESPAGRGSTLRATIAAGTRTRSANAPVR